ncbi:MAG TPA: hypothetical protein PKK12_14835, partial [Candidatus Aminicenantes bacterium]|nr:hypothetical protein [Candidatus Aminicenantes bacterium]
MKRPMIFTLLLSTGLFLTAGAPQVNVLSLMEGAFPLVVPAHYGGWNAECLLDDSPGSGWACQEGKTQNNVFVFELVGPTTLERFEFDNAAIDTEGSGAREVLVEVSTTSARDGYTPVLMVSLAAKADGQKFPAAKAVPARWVRLTLKSNHGSGEYTELFSFRGFGPRPEQTTQKDVSGTYESTYSAFHLRQQGTALNGCYEYNDGLLTGVIEGRVMKLTWTEDGGRTRGPAVMVFAPDGTSFRGFWWRESEVRGAPSGVWDGTRKSPQVGGCPHWSGSVGGELKSKLTSEGRARLYGILFDTDSAVIK